MAGEDEESDDPNSYDKKPAYQRFIIVVAGAIMNIIIAILLIFIVCLSTQNFATTKIHSFNDNVGNVSEYQGLYLDDEIIKVGDQKVVTAEDLSYEIMLNGGKPIDITVIRDGKEQIVRGVTFPTESKDGFEYGKFIFVVYPERRSFGSVMKNTFYSSVSAVRMIWDSILGLISGKFGLGQLSGPIGVTGAMVQVAKVDFVSFLNLVAVISMNLGVFNLLPIPALDGGTLLLTTIEMITKKRLPKKTEDIIKLVGFGILMALVVFVSIKDIVKLFI